MDGIGEITIFVKFHWAIDTTVRVLILLAGDAVQV